MKLSHTTHDRDSFAPLAGERQPTSDEFAIAMARALSNTLALAHLCLSPRCRRTGKCKGDPRECLEVGETVLSPDVVDGARLFLEGQLEGLSFDRAVAAGPQQVEAYLNWIGHIAPMTPSRERGSVPG